MLTMLRHVELISLLSVLNFNFYPVNGELTPSGSLVKCRTYQTTVRPTLLPIAWTAEPINITAVECKNGLWPTQADPELDPVMGQTYSALNLQEISMKSQDYKSLPNRPLLTRLNFYNITVLDRDAKSVRFPLQKFTELLPRKNIITLILQAVNLYPELSESDLVGFTGLESLSLAECGICVINPRTFYSIAGSVISDTGITSYQSKLADLRLTSDELRSFPWDSLFPVAGSIQSISIRYNKELAAVTHDQTAAPSMKFTSLRSVWFTNSKLTALPQTVVNTLDSAIASQSAPQYPFDIRFLNSDNKCGSCELVPLLKWALDHGESSVKLVTTCIYNHLEFEHTYLNATDFSKAYPVSDCKEVVEFSAAEGTHVGSILSHLLMSFLLILLRYL